MALLTRAGSNTLRFSNNCFYKFSQNCVKLKWQIQPPCIFATCIQGSTIAKYFNTGPISPDITNKTYQVFDNAMSLRRDQAQRSILVQVQSEQSSFELYNYCSQFGSVKDMHHYTINDTVHFILIEFNSLSDVTSMNAGYDETNDHESLPVVSSMLWFRATKKKDKIKLIPANVETPLNVSNGTTFPATDVINQHLMGAESVCDQMTILCNSTQLNDTEIRLRFLTARQIEACLSGIFANVEVVPFGSSVNSFGKHGCDLDLVVKTADVTQSIVRDRLVHHTKLTASNSRQQAQRTMVVLSDIMQQFLPGITHIRRILHARVPIIKYNQILTGLDCDLSMTNTTGVHMSELLYLYGKIDWRVRPLIFTIRMWAQSVKLTNTNPGSWITNFSLTLLTLFYLQQKQILPSVQQLVKLANKNDIRIADGYVDCTFLRDISRLPKSDSQNIETLHELLINFFIYYSNFDFATKAVSLNTGTVLPKPDDSNVYIYNPLEQGCNVTKNMSVIERERLRIEIRNAAWLLESAADIKNLEWGLLPLFHQKGHSGTLITNQQTRMMELSTLFSKSSPIGHPSNDITNVQSNSNRSSMEKKVSGTVITNTLRQGKDMGSMNMSSGAKNRSSAVNRNVEKQGVSNSKWRNSRQQEWRR